MGRIRCPQGVPKAGMGCREHPCALSHRAVLTAGSSGYHPTQPHSDNPHSPGAEGSPSITPKGSTPMPGAQVTKNQCVIN